MKNIIIQANFEELSGKWRRFLPGAKTYSKHIMFEVLENLENDLSKVARLVEITVILADDEFIRPLKSEYFGKDEATNVLSFPAVTMNKGKLVEAHEVTEGYIYLGEIIASIETLQREAEEQHKSLTAHFTHLMVHSILHLLGYDHQLDVEAEEMEALEIMILRKCFKLASPY